MQCPAGHLAIKYRIDKRSNQKKEYTYQIFFSILINAMSVLIVMAAIKKMQKPKRIVSLLKSDYHKNQEAFQKNTIFQGTFQNPLYDRGKK